MPLSYQASLGKDLCNSADEWENQDFYELFKKNSPPSDVGLSGMMSRANQPGTRLLYSNEGHLYITTDHYVTVHPIGTWK